ERMADVGGVRGECTLRTEEDDVLFADLLDRREVEEFVPGQRAADGAAELMARVVVLFQIEGAFGAEGLVAEEAERVAVDVVGARLGNDRQRAARGSADLGVEAVLD